MMRDEDRLRLRHTFNTAAESYHRVRPDYPAGLFDDRTWPPPRAATWPGWTRR